jgi:hypothetical protein
LYWSEITIIEINLKEALRIIKKLAAGVHSAVLLVGGATDAFANTDSSKLGN